MQIEAIYQIYKNHPVISIDNRKVERGCIFVGIKGEKFDGNAFALSALEAGAAYAIIDNEMYFVDERTILVKDTLEALQQLANYHRKTFDIPFIAICGSNGKTTTKELTYAVLSTTYKTFATKGNLNNHIGVPLTLLSIPPDTEMAIIEIGANHLEETYSLCKIAEPDFGVVTNNGKDHLEGFGNIENVITANAELFKWLDENNGTAFVNTRYPDLVKASGGVRQMNYGFELADHFPFSILPGELAAIKCMNPELEISSQLFGQFNCDNIATAAVIGHYFEVPAAEIKSAIGNYKPGMNRSQILVTNNITFYVDCYNANPSSMQLAIDSFVQSAATPKGVVLADMLELGTYSLEEHTAIIKQLSTLELDKIILVGKYFGMLKDLVPSVHFEKTEDATAWFSQQDFSGWSFLLKGSRGYTLEKLINF
jgi:UDP-N-acetylmuramoyl-tripeptide--D-alanyl-D-alanine ligase